MEQKVADLIIDIIGNGKPCSTSDWAAIRKALPVVKNTSDNKASPKLPTLDECYNEARVAVIYELTFREITAIKAVYDFIVGKIGQ